MQLTKNLNQVPTYVAYLLSCLSVLIIVVLAIRFGSVNIPVSTIFYAIVQEGLGIPMGGDIPPAHVQIVLNVRLPRVLLTLFVGASLAIAGAAFQGLLRNPLADPFTLGVSSGSALGAVAVLFFQISFIGLWTLPLVSMVSGFLTLLAVIFFTRLIQRTLSNETVILTGIIMSAFLGAWLSLFVALSQEELRHVINWLMGSVGMRGWPYVGLIIPFFISGFVLLLLCRRELNAFMYGEETAQYLGVSVQKKKYMILGAATILTGSAVAVSGTIGFVGLVVPHMVRTVWGPNHGSLLPLSAIVGAGFLVLMDLVARTVAAPIELPIGVVTALIGSPIFAWMLYRQSAINKRGND